MPLPAQPDCADLVADAILSARKAKGPLFRDDIAAVARPVIAAAVEVAVAAARAADPLKHTGTKKEREALFSAICVACGLNEEGMTKPMARTVATCRAHIVKVLPNCTPEEIILRGKQYRRKHPSWDLQPMALAKHWGDLAAPGSMQGALDEPVGWRERVGVIFPEADFGATGAYLAKQPWPQLAREHQQRICRLSAQPSSP